MSHSELTELMNELTSCGEALIRTGNALKKYFSKHPITKLQEDTKSDSSDIPDEPILTKEEVRSRLAKKAHTEDGKYNAAVKDLVHRYSNGGSFGQIDKKYYPDIVKELEEIGDA